MNLPAWLEGLNFGLHLATWQEFGLAFLLGSFAVATWSDLKRLSAQREFVEIWLLFLCTVLAFDFYHTYYGDTPSLAFGLKWGLIVVFSVLSRIGVLFRLAPADVAALAASASLLTPALIVLFYILAKIIALLVRPLFGAGRPTWPFMPVVSLATLAILALAWWS